MQVSVKQGITSVLKPFQRSKMLFKFKRDQKCKKFPFWAKTVKFAKMGVPTEKTSFLKDLSCLSSKSGLKMYFQ